MQAMLAFWWILPMNPLATISTVQVPVLSHKCEQSEQQQTCVVNNDTITQMLLASAGGKNVKSSIAC